MNFKLSANSILRQWGFEIYCVVMAVSVLGAMIVVLIVFDSEPVFDGPVITLNAIISTLSTAIRVALLAMFASAISQWNWLLFSGKSRRLLDFEHFAEASRGPLGSLKVLLNSHIVGGSVVRFGALLTILTIALDPFAQQLVQIEEELRSFEPEYSRDAVVNIAQEYSKTRASETSMNDIIVDGEEVSGDTNAKIAPDYAMEIAAMASFADDASGLTLGPGFQCSQGSCIFDSYESLAVCSHCDNVTPSLKRRTREAPSMAFEYGAGRPQDKKSLNSTEYYLPNGLHLTNMNSKEGTDDDEDWLVEQMLMTMFGTGNGNKTVNMHGIDTLIWAQSFIKASRELEVLSYDSYTWPGPEVSAFECELHYCVKEFEGSIEGGRLRETYKENESYKRDPNSWKMVTENLFLPDLPAWTDDYLAFHPVLSTIPRTPLVLGLPPSYEKGYTIEPFAVWGNSMLMKNLFTSCIDRNDNCTEENQDASFGPPNGFYTGNYTDERRPDFATDFFYSTDLNETFRRIAESMTNALRNGADAMYWNMTDEGNEPKGLWAPPAAVGKSLRPVPIYKATWPWIALHCTLTLGGAVFLALTARFTAKAGLPAWKSSELAIFAQAGGIERIFDGDEKQGELERKAKEESVTLLGWRNREVHVSSRQIKDSVSAEEGNGSISPSLRARAEESAGLAEGTPESN